MTIEQGKLVSFRVSPTISGVGKVCGLSTTGEAVIGRGIIVEIMKSEGIHQATYPYTHMVIFENQITGGEFADVHQEGGSDQGQTGHRQVQ